MWSWRPFFCVLWCVPTLVWAAPKDLSATVRQLDAFVASLPEPLQSLSEGDGGADGEELPTVPPASSSGSGQFGPRLGQALGAVVAEEPPGLLFDSGPPASADLRAIDGPVAYPTDARHDDTASATFVQL